MRRVFLLLGSVLLLLLSGCADGSDGIGTVSVKPASSSASESGIHAASILQNDNTLSNYSSGGIYRITLERDGDTTSVTVAPGETAVLDEIPVGTYTLSGEYFALKSGETGELTLTGDNCIAYGEQSITVEANETTEASLTLYRNALSRVESVDITYTGDRTDFYTADEVKSYLDENSTTITISMSLSNGYEGTISYDTALNTYKILTPEKTVGENKIYLKVTNGLNESDSDYKEFKNFYFDAITTVYVKSTGSDDNLGTEAEPFATLQAAINKIAEVNDGATSYTIYVDGTLTASDSTGENLCVIGGEDSENGTLNAALNLTIEGVTSEACLDGDGKSRVISVAKTDYDVNVALKNLKIANGESEDSTGGGVNVLGGKLTMEGCTVSGCKAVSYGAGIYTASGVSLSVSECTFSNNVLSDKTKREDVYTLSEKWTDTIDDAGGYNMLSSGEWQSVTTVYVQGEGGTYTPDTAASDDNSNANLGLKDSPFATLQAAINTITADDRNTDGEASYTIYMDGTFTGDSTNPANYAEIGGSTNGKLTSDLNLTIAGTGSGATFTGAYDPSGAAPTSGSGRFLLVDAASASNPYSVNLTLKNLTVTKCFEASGDTYDTPPGSGGAVCIGAGYGAASVGNDGTITMSGGKAHTLIAENCTFSDCYARYDSGAVWIGAYGTFKATNCTLSGNSATHFGGAVGGRANTSLTFKDCKFLNNKGDTNDGGAAAGGGALLINSGWLYIEGGEISGNNNADQEGNGGAIWTAAKTFIIGVTFKNNTTIYTDGSTAKNAANSIYLSGSGSLYLTGGSFESESYEAGKRRDLQKADGTVYTYKGSGSYTDTANWEAATLDGGAAIGTYADWTGKAWQTAS